MSPTNQPIEPSVFMITADNRVFFAETDFETVGLGTVSGDVITFDTGATVTLTGTLSGNFDLYGLTGSFSLSDTGLYSRSPSLTDLSGVWVDDVFTSGTGIITISIDSSGNVTFTSVSGCTGSGSVSLIDSGKNAFSLNMTYDATCGAGAGNYTGLGFLDDTNFQNDTFNVVLENSTADSYIFSAAIKQ